MESRKIQITGKSTYIVSLPKKWVLKAGLSNGDSVNLVPGIDGTLLIKPTQGLEPKMKSSVILSLQENDIETFNRKFISAYLAGYDEIEIDCNNCGERVGSEIRNVSAKLVGLEIIEETSRTCIVKDLIDSSDFSMLKAIRRMHLITKEMVKESSRITESSLNSFRSSDVEIDKIYWMIARQHNMVLGDIFFAEKLQVTPQEAFCNLLVARSLEKIADRTLKIASNMIKVENLDFKTKVDGIIPDILELMDNSVRSYFTTNFDLANEVVCMSSGLELRINRLNNDVLNEPSVPSQIAAYVIIIDCLGRIISYIVDIAETAMNHEYVKKLQSSPIVA